MGSFALILRDCVLQEIWAVGWRPSRTSAFTMLCFRGIPLVAHFDEVVSMSITYTRVINTGVVGRSCLAGTLSIACRALNPSVS